MSPPWCPACSRGNGPDVVSAKTAADRFTFSKIPAPVVTSITPSSGSLQGGDAVVVTGKYLDGGRISFGTSGTSPVTCTDTRCAVIAPYHGSTGTVDVTVTTSAGTSPARSADRFSYLAPGLPTVTKVSPASGTATGGSTVVVTGTNLTGGTVFFGRVGAVTTSCTSATSCTAVAPAQAAGAVDVQVNTSAGKSALGAADQYDYVNPPAPVVSSIRLRPAGQRRHDRHGDRDEPGRRDGVVRPDGCGRLAVHCYFMPCGRARLVRLRTSADVAVTTPGGNIGGRCF